MPPTGLGYGDAMSDPRAHDLVLFGATGFTGRLVAEYLAEHAPEGLRWALAGRDAAKLERIRGELAARWPKAAALPILVGDALDAEAMARIAGQTRVVCTTVGPYARFGGPLVDACARLGTDYCDLTGETHFIRRSIDTLLGAAEASGARIVHCCGFDSIPSDLGVFMLGEAMAERGARLAEVRCFFGESKGSFSGGTLASLLNMLDELKRDPSLRKVLGHPYGLNPEGERSGPDGSDRFTVRHDAELGMWVGPFVMAAINTRVVRRSNAVRGWPFGRDFRYSEELSFGRGPAGLARAAAMTGGLGGFMAALQVGPVRGLLESRVLPKPGEGPSEAERESGYFVTRLFGRGVRADGGELRLKGKVTGHKDPGYGETAKMLGQSALCLVQDPPTVGGGVWTPASALGAALLARLRAAGMGFEVTA